MGQINFVELRKKMQAAFPYITATPSGMQSVSGAGWTLCLECVDEINKDDTIAEKVAGKTVEEAVSNVLSELKIARDASDATVDSRTKAMVKELRDSIRKLLVFLPVDGLSLGNMRQFTVGSVTFYPAASMTSRFKKIMLQHSATDTSALDDRTRANRKRDREAFLKSLGELPGQCTAMAEVRLEADPKAAQDMAYGKVKLVADMLRCFTSKLQRHGFYPAIGTGSSLGSRETRSAVFYQDHSNASITWSCAPGFGSYEIDPDRVKILESKLAFRAIEAVLAKAQRQRTDSEKIITTAIKWIGNGVAAYDATDKVLCFCIALEVMMTGGERGDIAERVAMRLALLLTSDRKRRDGIYRLAKDLYSLRSEVVHAGGASISSQNLMDLEAMAVSALVALAKNLRRWKTHDDFTKWVRQKQFG